MALDTLKILRAIDDNPDVFRDTRFAVQEAVAKLNEKLRKLIADEIRACDSIAALKRIRTTLGTDSFSTLVAGMPDLAVKKIVGSFDPHHPQKKSGSGSWQREHLLAILDGTVSPSERPIKAPRTPRVKTEKAPAKPKAPKAPKTPKANRSRKKLDEFLDNESAGLTWPKDRK